MITRSFKSLAGILLQGPGITGTGCLPVRDLTGRTRYCLPDSSYPFARTLNLTLDASEAGISVGSGNAPATEDDYQLESTITSGISMSVIYMGCICSQPGVPILWIRLAVNNTGSEAVTIREIGYKQTVNTALWPGLSVDKAVVCLIDRTVFDAPLELQPGNSGIIEYQLKTKTTGKTISGVDIVSWEWGTDAQIVAMIEAARNGVIDLQRDAGWRVGDIRKVSISAFTGGGGVSHAAQDVGLVISSFEEYEGCGNVMQFDFIKSLATGNRMNTNSTNVGGYGGSEMYTTTLPALVEALPSWLQGLLKTFSVKVSAGNGSSTIETVTGNKLALRSEVEITGSADKSVAGEGSLQDLYRINGYGAKGAPLYWMRSPDASGNKKYCAMILQSRQVDTANASSIGGVAPFGCI